MKYSLNSFFIALLLLLNCSSNTEPQFSEGLLINDLIDLSFDADMLDTLQILDIDFKYIYHYENSSGQITKYSYTLRDFKTNFSFSNGWKMKFDRHPRGRTNHFLEQNINDTLSYSKLFNISEADTVYKEFQFKLEGFFCDTPFWNSEDTLKLEPYEYCYRDTILIIP